MIVSAYVLDGKLKNKSFSLYGTIAKQLLSVSTYHLIKGLFSNILGTIWVIPYNSVLEGQLFYDDKLSLNCGGSPMAYVLQHIGSQNQLDNFESKLESFSQDQLR